MKKLLLFALVIVSVVLGYSWSLGKDQPVKTPPKKVILKIGLVADSENENDLLARALRQAKEQNVNFVIGLGDWTNTGTIEELAAVKKVFDDSGEQYFLTAGDHDLWDSRNRGEEALSDYLSVFGEPTQQFEKNGIQFVIVDNSDIYKGISPEDWQNLNSWLAGPVTTFPPASALSGQKSDGVSQNQADLRAVGSPSSRATRQLTFVFAHKTPFHPDSAHVMGEDSPAVANQANRLIKLIEDRKVSGLFTGDLHFFAQFKSLGQSVKISTIGAVSSERNFQGPRFAILKVYDDATWEVEDVEIRM